MKAVILAAGNGKRMRPLSLETPKPLLQVNGKPIIDHILDSLPEEISEVIIAVKYQGDKIKNHLRQKTHPFKIKFVTGSDKGPAYSFLAAKKHLDNERFLVIYGDQVPNPRDIKNCLSQSLSILTFISQNPQAHGIGFLREDGTFKKIVEKPKTTTSNIGVDGIMVLNTNIFNCEPVATNGEFYLATMVDQFVRSHKVHSVRAENYLLDINTPDDLIRAGNNL